MNAVNCLLITTSNDRLGATGNKTGVWMEDLAAAYFIFRDAGEYITFASPKGGHIPVDPNTIRFQLDAQAMYHFLHALPLKEIKAEDFDMVFVVGGYGAMWDLPGSEWVKKLLDHFIEANKPIGLVGHAVVALTSLTQKNGEPFVKGRRLTAFSNSEEELSGLAEEPPFLLASKLLSLGAIYSSGAEFASYVVVDGNIITGQNPASSVETAHRLLECVHRIKMDKRAALTPLVF